MWPLRGQKDLKKYAALGVPPASTKRMIGWRKSAVGKDAGAPSKQPLLLVDCDHYVGRLDHRIGFFADGQLQIVGGCLGND